jgi:hypothetical protein
LLGGAVPCAAIALTKPRCFPQCSSTLRSPM